MNDKKDELLADDDVLRLASYFDEQMNNKGIHLGDDLLFLALQNGLGSLDVNLRKHVENCLYCQARLSARREVMADARRQTETEVVDTFYLKAAADSQTGVTPLRIYSERYRFELEIMPLENMEGECVVTFIGHPGTETSLDGRHISICDGKGTALLDGIVRDGIMRQHYERDIWSAISSEIDLSVLTLVKLPHEDSGNK